MNVALVTVGYNLPGFTTKLLDSALDGCCHDVTAIVISHASMPDKVRELETLAARSNVIYKGYGENRGLAKSWNEGVLEAFERGFDVVLVVNEDVTFGPGDLTQLAEAAALHRENYIVTGRAFHHSEGVWSSSSYGCFAINPVAIEQLGCFDENLFPVYYEDADYKRRAALARISSWHCDVTAIQHGGSQSLSQSDVARQNRVTWTKNREYFNRKWGGDPAQEKFMHPFDDMRYTYYIDPRLRDSPYSGFNRNDQHIVKV